MDIDLDEGIKKIDVMIEERKAFNYYSQGEFISFCQMKEVLEAMRTKISHICDKCANECKATHLRAECSLYTPKPSQGQDPCKVPVETVGFPENVVKTWLTTCQKIHQDTIFIDRKVAESWLRVKPLNFMSAADIQLYGEFKRALGGEDMKITLKSYFGTDLDKFFPRNKRKKRGKVYASKKKVCGKV